MPISALLVPAGADGTPAAATQDEAGASPSRFDTEYLAREGKHAATVDAAMNSISSLLEERRSSTERSGGGRATEAAYESPYSRQYRHVQQAKAYE